MLIGYARVSTNDQKPQLQIDALKAAGCERIFVERASGGSRDRQEFRAALDYLRGEGAVLVVWRLDRLARSLSQLIHAIEQLDECKIGFRSLAEAIDTTSPGGRLVFHIFRAIAEFEREIIRERTGAGLATARSRGKKGGRPPVLGPKEIQQAKAMLRDPNIMIAEVAERLGVAQSTFFRHLPGGRAGLEKESPDERGTCQNARWPLRRHGG